MWRLCAGDIVIMESTYCKDDTECIQNACGNLVTEKAHDAKISWNACDILGSTGFRALSHRVGLWLAAIQHQKWKQAEKKLMWLWIKLKIISNLFKDRGQTVASSASLLCPDQTNTGTRCVAKANRRWRSHRRHDGHIADVRTFMNNDGGEGESCR